MKGSHASETSPISFNQFEGFVSSQKLYSPNNASPRIFIDRDKFSSDNMDELDRLNLDGKIKSNFNMDLLVNKPENLKFERYSTRMKDFKGLKTIYRSRNQSFAGNSQNSEKLRFVEKEGYLDVSRLKKEVRLKRAKEIEERMRKEDKRAHSMNRRRNILGNFNTRDILGFTSNSLTSPHNQGFPGNSISKSKYSFMK